MTNQEMISSHHGLPPLSFVVSMREADDDLSYASSSAPGRIQSGDLRPPIRIDRKLKTLDVIDVLSDLLILRGVSPHPFRQRSGVHRQGGARMIAAVGARTAFIEPGSPWGERVLQELQVQAPRRDPNGEIFYSLAEARIIVES